VEHDEKEVTVHTLPEALLSEVVEQDVREEIADAPRWLLEGVFQWCNQEGVVEATHDGVERDEQGMPLIIPGTPYAITLSATKWDLLKAGATLVINLSLANPVNWVSGTALATGMTVITLLQNMQKLSEAEKLVRGNIGRIKRKQYSRLNRWPELNEIAALCSTLTRESVEKSLDALVEMKLVKKADDSFAIVL
jgi:hypothetical protein